MNATAIAGQKADLSESQRIALLKLLPDEDPAVYQTIRQRILDSGPSVVGWLQPHLLSGDPLLRRRVQEIIDHIARETADNRFLTFCVSQGEDFDIERGLWMLCQTRYPDINIDAYQALLDSYAADAREGIEAGAPGKDVLGRINQCLFENLRFSGNENNYYDPENSYLNRVLDRRTGNPISLCLVYLAVARRLQLPITGIALPGHFVCRYQTPTDEIYLDAFNQGRFLSKADCIRYLIQTSQGFQGGLLSPASPRRILYRVCSNLHQIYTHLKHTEETERFKHYLVALAK